MRYVYVSFYLVSTVLADFPQVGSLVSCFPDNIDLPQNACLFSLKLASGQDQLPVGRDHIWSPLIRSRGTA